MKCLSLERSNAPHRRRVFIFPQITMGTAWTRRGAVPPGLMLPPPNRRSPSYWAKKIGPGAAKTDKKERTPNTKHQTPNTKHQTPNPKSTSNAALRRSRRRSRRSFNQAPNSSSSGNFDQKGQILAFAFAFAAVPAMGGHHVLAIVGAATATHPNIQSLLQIREAGASAFDLIEHVSLAHPGAHAYDHFRPFPCEASWRRLALTKQRE